MESFSEVESLSEVKLLSGGRIQGEHLARAPLPELHALAVLGVVLDPITLPQVLERIDQMICSGSPHYIATANVDFLIQARRDMELHRVLLEADLVLCDGTPVVWASHLFNKPLPERVAGADLAPRLIEQAVEKQYRLFFLGGEPEVLAKAVGTLKCRYPRLNIAGAYAPPFSPLLQMDHEDITRRIQSAKPDLVFVSFGCPKAEKWMAMHHRTLGVPVMIGVGGTIDFLAGEKRRAPAWMQRSGTEWIFRLLQEPRRLAGRYAKDLQSFVPGLCSQWWAVGRGARKGDVLPPCSIVVKEPTWVRMRLPSRFDHTVVARDRAVWEQIHEQHCLLDMGPVEFIDSAAIGCLARLHRRLEKAGYHLVLIDPSSRVRAALRYMRLENLLLSARDIFEAREKIQEREQEHGADWTLCYRDGLGVLSWRGEITARNAASLWQNLQTRWLNPANPQKQLTLDFTGVRYLDSAGLRVLLHARQQAQQAGTRLQFTGFSPALRKLVRQAGVETVLFGNGA